jgi:hypothetical protein
MTMMIERIVTCAKAAQVLGAHLYEQRGETVSEPEDTNIFWQIANRGFANLANRPGAIVLRGIVSGDQPDDYYDVAVCRGLRIPLPLYKGTLTMSAKVTSPKRGYGLPLPDSKWVLTEARELGLL